MLPVPSAPLMVSRRRLLVGTAALALLGASATACGSPPPPPGIDEVIDQLHRARADSRLAADAADAAPPEQRQPLHTIAAERAAHADALSDEIVRMIGPEAAATSTATPAATPGPGTAQPSRPGTGPRTAERRRPPDATEVAGALQRSAESAARLAAELSGYRAGLLGSIAAACTAAAVVVLGAPEQTS